MKIMKICVLLLLAAMGAAARADTSGAHLRVSLLTVGVGDEIYASFGHTGIRVVDSAKGTDIVYNWGTFDGFQEDFELKFMRGKLLYYASSESFQHFYSTYVREQRGVEEQKIHLTDTQKLQLQAFLQENIKEENKYYKYDFLYDNCATRLRDVFPKTFGTAFRWGPALPAGSKLTFRDEINHYLAPLPWERFGINLLLGAKIDKVMKNEDAMFLPDYLRDGLAGATVDGVRVAGKAERILPPAPPLPPAGNGPFILTLTFAAIVILGSVIPGFNIIGHIAGNALLIITGLLGCLMLFMWIGTDHEACRSNWNVLWALPTNLIVPFAKREKLGRYALVALVLLLAAVVIHMLQIQALAMRELWPILLALGLRFGMIYRTAGRPLPDEPEAHHHH
jgi:hypothetical protein